MLYVLFPHQHDALAIATIQHVSHSHVTTFGPLAYANARLGSARTYLAVVGARLSHNLYLITICFTNAHPLFSFSG